MKRVEEDKYQLVLADGRPALFTNGRLDRDSIPDGLYCYDVRHADEDSGLACEIKSYVLVNHWGTILTKEEIPLTDGSYYLNEDFSYLWQGMEVDEFILKTHEEIMMEIEKSMQRTLEMNQSQNDEITGLQQMI